MKNLLIGLLIIVAFVGGYFFSQKYNFKIESKNSSQITPIISPTIKPKPLVGNDSDEHGCKGSAGYTWCEIKQKCLRTWEEFCGEISPTIMKEETQDLKMIIKQLLINKYGQTSSGLTITVSKEMGDYARGGASEQGGGGMWLAKKINGSWQLIFDGNGAPDCGQLKTTYLFPKEILVGICD